VDLMSDHDVYYYLWHMVMRSVTEENKSYYRNNNLIGEASFQLMIGKILNLSRYSSVFYRL
jgi:hypothetical protein